MKKLLDSWQIYVYVFASLGKTCAKFVIFCQEGPPDDPWILTHVKKLLTCFRSLSRLNKLDLCGLIFTECWPDLEIFFFYICQYPWVVRVSLQFCFHQLGPLGRVGHRVAMSVCQDVCLCVCQRHQVQFFPRPLISPEITWSVPGHS